MRKIKKPSLDILAQDFFVDQMLKTSRNKWQRVLELLIRIFLSMDGPNVNSERESNDRAKLFGIGNCGLHTVHHAFQRGVLSTDIDTVLRSMSNVGIFAKRL